MGTKCAQNDRVFMHEQDEHNELVRPLLETVESSPGLKLYFQQKSTNKPKHN